jgi:hypothetical protein
MQPEDAKVDHDHDLRAQKLPRAAILVSTGCGFGARPLTQTGIHGSCTTAQVEIKLNILTNL